MSTYNIKSQVKYNKWITEREEHFRNKIINENVNNKYETYWTQIKCINVITVEDSNFVAVPVSGRKNSKKFNIIDIKNLDFVCQLDKKDVSYWLIKNYIHNEKQ